MYFRAAAFVVLTASCGLVRPQQFNTLDPIGFQNDNLSGTAVGTASDGTTYVLQGVTSSIPFNLTLFEGPSTISETASIPSLSLTVNVQCVVDGALVSCIDIAEFGPTTTTLTETGPFQPIAVPTGSFSSNVTTSSTTNQTTVSTTSTSTTSSVSSTSSTSTSETISQTSITSPPPSPASTTSTSPTSTSIPGGAMSIRPNGVAVVIGLVLAALF